MAGLLGDETGAGRKPYVAPRQVTLAEDVRRLGGLLSSLIPDPFQHGSLSGAARNTARALQGGHYKVEYGPNGEVYQTDEWIPYEGGQMDRLLGVNPLLEFAGGAGVAAPLAKVPKGALMAFGDVGNIRGWHGGPHKFDKFDLSKIGTGEGAQAYGHGGYLAQSRDIADKYYREALTSHSKKFAESYLKKAGGDIEGAKSLAKAEIDRLNAIPSAVDGMGARLKARNREALTILEASADPGDLKAGHLYEVELDAQPHEMLDWDKPLSEQSDYVSKKLRDIWVSRGGDPERELPWAAHSGSDGYSAYAAVSTSLGGEEKGAKALREAGIKGIRYLDGNSRGKGEGTYNYVFFDDKDALIHTRDGEPIRGLLSEGGDDAAKAAYKAEFGKDVYHGTHATDLQEFDPDMVDIGVHVGTQEQAVNRLKSLSNPLSSGRSADYRSGANVLPLKARIENPLELPDVGLWNDSASVAKELNKRGLIDDEFLGEISEVKGQFEDLEDFIGSSENREFLDELRGAIEGAGYDSVKYKNLVENEYGDLTKMLPDARQRETAILEELRKYEDAILDTRRPKLPEDMSDKDGMRRFLDSSSNALDYATPEEAARIKELYGRAEKIRSNPASYADPHSYIVLDPSNLRGRFAKFDPSKRDSGNLLAGIGAGGVVGGGALMAGGQEAEARPRNNKPIKGLLAD